jgi:4-hydroxybenzoate polyprenyltransferase
MKWVVALTLLWIISNAATDHKGTFLAAVEGFSARELSRPWDYSNNKRMAIDLRKKKHSSSLIRFYVNEEHPASSSAREDEEDSEAAAAMCNNVTTHKEEDTRGSSAQLFSSDATFAAAAAAAAPSSNSSVVVTAATSIQPLSHGYHDHSVTPPPQEHYPTPSVKSCLPDLIAMTRPSNLPGVVLFHMLGTYLAIQNSATPYWSTLLSPSMMITLMALLLTSSTSMLVNDYYDFKLGNDSNKLFKPLNTPSRLTLIVAKRFLSYLYAAALVCVAMVPGAPARMSVVMGLMMTFWYTQHLKPRTWLKNAVCASLIALSPLTSGVAAISLTGTATTGWSQLLRVVSMLFIGILGREMTMDINDAEDDSNHGVRTVPVVYGRKFASTAALVCSMGVTGLAILGPLLQSLAGDVMISWRSPLARRWLLAILGGTAQVRRGWQVFKSEGQDPETVKTAVEEGLLTVVVLLASFV